MLLFVINKTFIFILICFSTFSLVSSILSLFGIYESFCCNNSKLKITASYSELKFLIISTLTSFRSSKYIAVKLSILFINNKYCSYIFEKFSFIYSIIFIYSSVSRISLLNLYSSSKSLYPSLYSLFSSSKI